MEKIMENKIAKTVFAVVILFTMLFSYIPAISNAANDDDTDYMVFEANCKAGSTVTSNENIAFGYTFNLKGVQTGFKNVVLSIKDEDLSTPVANISCNTENKLDSNTQIINNGRYSVINFGNVRTGTDFAGTINVYFDRKADFSTYQKTITFMLEADYRDPVTGITTRQTIEKDVTLNVKSAPMVDKFSSNVEIKQNIYTSDLGQRILGNSYLGAHYAKYTSDGEYAIDEVNASYNVKINAENLCYGQFVLKVSKSPEFNDVELLDTNSEENLIVDLSQVPSEFATQVVRNDDGTADIILTYKTKKDEYTIDDMDETTNYDFNIKVKYKINYSITRIVRVPAGSTEETVVGKVYKTWTVTEYKSETTTSYTTLQTPSEGPYFVNHHQALGNTKKLRDGTVLASRDTIDRASMLNIKMEAANMAEQPIAVLAEEPAEEPNDDNTEEVTLPGTIRSNSAVNKATATVLKDISVLTYTSEEDIPAGAETIEIDETTDRLVTDEGSMVTIRGSYSAECEGLDIYLSNEGTTTEKRTLKYTNSDSTEFLSASQIVEEAGGSHIYGIDKYLDSELESIEDGNFEISFTSKGNIYHKTAFDHVGELVLYDYNVENALDFFEEVGIGAGNNHYDSDCRPTIKYIRDNGYTTTKVLQNNELQVKSIRMSRLPDNFDVVKFYKKGEAEPFFIATSPNDTYTVPANQTITEFYVTTNMGMDAGEDFIEWVTDYTIPVQTLLNLGLSETEIENITEITKYQYGSYRGSNSTMTSKGTATIIDPDKLNPKLSYMEFSAKKANEDNFNTLITNTESEPIELTFTLRKNLDVIKGINSSVYDVNPTLYVKLNPIFDYENFKVNITNNAHLVIKNTEKVTINNQEYLKVECEGTYNSNEDGTINITISCFRELIDNGATKYQTMEAFLITDNKNYYSSSDNTNGLVYNENEIPAKVFKTSTSFTVEQTNLIQVYSEIGAGRRTYIPNSATATSEFSEKEMPVIANSNTSVKFIGELKNSGKQLNNVNLIYRLPINNSKNIQFNTNLIENDYTLSEEFKNKYDSALNDPYNTDGTVKHNSLINLDNIKVYAISNGKAQELNRSQYTLGYSEDLTAGFDSTFTEIEDGVTDLTDAAVLQVKINRVNKNTSIKVEYTMDMPEDGGMAAAQFGARYLEEGDSSNTTLDSEAAYIINGDDRSNLQIQKKFEGYDVGTAPTGVSLSGIQFKLKDSTGNFVKSGEDDLVATTDATGKASFTGLTPGQYQIIETSEFEEFNGIGNLVYLNLGLAETVEYEAENPRKTGTLNIQKHFEDTNEIKGNATFKLTRSSVDSIVYSTSVTTDAEGKATILGVPYGEYRLTETKTAAGYGIPEAQTITIDSESKDIEITNPLGRGTIIINKTVPEGESVKELSFHITGLGAVSYTNTEGETITNDTELTVKLSDDYSSNENIDVEIDENELTAKITLSNLPLGFYTIEETNIPTIGEDNVNKYTNVTRTVSLENDGSEETVNIINRKKTGYLQIKKTAYIDGEEKQYIGDLSGFSVRVTGTSDYGTTVDRTITLDEDGNATTALEIGTYNVTEIPVDGYQAYYKNSEGDLVYSTTGTEVKITFNEAFNKGATTTQEIENVLTGVGFVRVEKTLEGITNPQTVLDAGIKFKITGKNAAGGRVEETINIDQLDTEKNVAYGVSNAILVGGDYELEELDSTVPEYFEGMAPREITFTTSSTQENPLVINVQNDRSKGELQISTQTDPEGGPLTGITYRVTEVKINDDGSYTKLDGTNGTQDTVQEVEGSNGQADTSLADIKEINAGNYLVEQVTIPAGYKKDMPQIVEVPADGIGYAIFVIEKDNFNKYTKLIVNKQILNKDNEIATSDDLAKAQLSADDSFEVKVTNVNTNQKYYTFISGAQNGTITDLPAGIYEIEEEYKPKYTLEGYYNSINGIAVDKLTQTAEGKYTFEIVQGTTEATNTVEITIKNKINTSFPYGGQTTVDNMSKLDMEKVEIVTESIVYIVDEDGNELPGAKFQLLDSDGKVVKIGTEGNILTTKNKKILIRGLEPGKYTLTNIEVPEGYLQPDDKEVVVYEDATRVSRIEIQKNIPRGMLTLSTTYVNANGDTKYVPRSKYKVVDSETGELVGFTKTATGDYRKSNLDDATTVITLKAGQVELQGLEVGRYEVGLVDVTDGFAMQKEEPEYITLVGNDEKDINVVVAKATTVQATAGYYNTMWLDDNGRLWIIGNNYYYAYGPLNKNINESYNVTPYQIQFPEDVFITNYHQTQYNTIAIDSQGRVWVWGSSSGYIGNGARTNEQTPVCLSEIEGTELNESYKNGTRILDVNACYNTYFLLDNEGKLWVWGWNSYGTVGNNSTNDVLSPICLTNIEGNPLYEAYDNGIKVVQIADMSGTGYTAGCIDSIGRVWMWGNYNYGILGIGPEQTSNQLTPICISDIESEFSNAKIEYLSISNSHALATDSEGNVWAWGNNNYGQLGSSNLNTVYYPQKLSKDLFDGAKIEKAYAMYVSGNFSMFIDEYGKVWSCGYSDSGTLGNGQGSGYVYTPQCISSLSELDNSEIISIENDIYGYHVVALDKNGVIWAWGGYNNYGELGTTPTTNTCVFPKKVETNYTKHLEYNLRFTKVVTAYYSAVAIDEYGNVWGYGQGRYCGLGNSYNNTPEFVRIPALVGKKVIDVVYTGSDAYIALTEDNHVYVWGYCDYGLVANDSYYYNIYAPLDITDKFDLEDGVTIVGVAAGYYYAGAALDSLGRVWTWGNGSYGQRGNGNTNSSNYTPVCISKDIDNNLNGVNVKSLYGGYECFIAIDDEGKMWFWGDRYHSGVESNIIEKMREYQSYYIVKPICLTDITESTLGYAYESGTRFKKFVGNNYTSSNDAVAAVLDEDGKVWIMYGPNYLGKRVNSYNNVPALCLNDDKDSRFYKESQKHEGYKIVDIYQTYVGLFATDNLGQTWVINSDCKEADVVYNIPSDIEYISYNASNQYMYLIDGYGQLWQWGSNTTCLSGVIENPLYNIKAKEVIKDGLVEMDTDKGEIYSVSSTDVKFFMYSEAYLEKYLGKNIVQTSKTIGNSIDYSYIIALDDEGKLWTWGGDYYSYMLGNNTEKGSEKPICLNTIEGTELCRTQISDSNFRIVKFEEFEYANTKYVYAYDNYGKIWTWGDYYTNGGNLLCGLNQNKVYTPTCTANIRGTELYKAYQEDDDFEFVKLNAKSATEVIGLDNHGNVWALRNGYMTRLNQIEGSTLNDIYNNSPEDGLEEAIYENYGDNFVYNGKVWSFKDNEYVCFETGKEGIKFEKIVRTGGYGNNSYFALDSQGKLWAYGVNKTYENKTNYEGVYGTTTQEYYKLGDNGISGDNAATPICISDIEGTDLYNEYINDEDFKIVDVIDLSTLACAIDNNGNAWIWGLNEYNIMGNSANAGMTPYCISRPIESTGATVKKIEQIYGKYNLGSNYYSYNGSRWSNYGSIYDYYNIICILDSNGYIWTVGGGSGYEMSRKSDWIRSYINNAPPILGSTSNKSVLSKVNGISNVTDIYIIDDNTNYNMILANTENGLYAWGMNSMRRMGFYSTSTSIYYYYAKPTWQDGSYTTYAGQSSTIYPEYSPRLVTDSINVKQIIGVVSNYYLVIDNDNKLWGIGDDYYFPRNLSKIYNGSEYYVCFSDYFDEFKGVEFVGVSDTGSSMVNIKDSEGNIYGFNGTSCTITYKNETAKPIIPYSSGTLSTKNIVSQSTYMAIDDEGNLYGWDAYDGLYDKSGTQDSPICITEEKISKDSVFQDNKTLINIPIANNIYGVKFTDIINDQIVLDENGDYWFFPETGNAINISEKMLGADNPLYGKTITKAINSGYVVADDNYIYCVSGKVPEKIMKDACDIEIEAIKYIVGTNNINYWIAVDTSGKVWTCGSGDYGILGNGSLDSISEPVCLSDIEGTALYNSYQSGNSIEQIYVNTESTSSNSCSIFAIDSDRKLWTWGKNSSGTLGNGTNKYSSRPICINNISDTELNDATQSGYGRIEKIKFMNVSGDSAVVAIDNNKKVWIWGSSIISDEHGAAKTIYSPMCIQGADGIENIKLLTSRIEFNIDKNTIGIYYDNSMGYVCMLDENGKIWTWGYNGHKQLGNNSTSNDYYPICLSTLESNTEMLNAYAEAEAGEKEFYIEKIVGSYNGGMYAIDNEGKVWTWGNNGNGQLGIGSTSQVLSPRCISNTGNLQAKMLSDSDFKIVDVIYGSMATTLVDNYGVYWKLVSNQFTEDGLYDLEKAKIKYEDELGITINDIYIVTNGNNITAFILDSDGKIWAYGANNYGQLANGTTTNSSTPVCINDNPDLTDINFTSIYSPNNMTIFALDDEGYVWSWGYNSSGITGSGTTANITSPIKLDINNVSDLQKSISIGSSAATAINDLGDAYIWGSATYGQLGNGATSGTFAPICVSDTISALAGKEIKIKFIKNYAGSTYVIDATGKIWTCGEDYNYELGDGTTGNKIQFICISELNSEEFNSTVFEKIACRDGSAVAIDSNGRVWFWGYNSYLTSGTVQRPALAQNYITDLSNYKAIDVGFNSNNYYVITFEGGYELVATYSSTNIQPIETAEPTEPADPELPTYDIINIKDFSKYIDEVLDETHIKDTDGKIYSISNDGTLTELSIYTAPAAPEYEPVEIDDVTIVDYSTCKALDDEGNLYVWKNYLGGFTTAGANADESVNVTENEYVIEPLYQNANGWSLIKVRF